MEKTRPVLEKAREAVKKVKAIGIIAGIVMIILGIITFFNPLLGQSIVIWAMIGGLFVSGVEAIVTFFASPKEMRNGFSLALGIIWVILCIFTFITAINADAMTHMFAMVGFNYFLGTMVAFTCIFTAINDFCLCSRAEELGLSKSGMIVSGVLGILAGIVMFSFPIGSMITLEIFEAIFLIAGGIVLLVRSLSYKNEKK